MKIKHVISIFVLLVSLVSYAQACEYHEGLAQQEKHQKHDVKV